MEKYLLSDESIAILKNFALHSPIADSNIDTSRDSVQALFEYKLIACSMFEYHDHGDYSLPSQLNIPSPNLAKAIWQSTNAI